MFTITELTTPTTRHVVKSFTSFDEAVAYAKANFPIVHFEQDGEAADFFTTSAVYAVYAIEADGASGAREKGWKAWLAHHHPETVT